MGVYFISCTWTIFQCPDSASVKAFFANSWNRTGICFQINTLDQENLLKTPEKSWESWGLPNITTLVSNSLILVFLQSSAVFTVKPHTRLYFLYDFLLCVVNYPFSLSHLGWVDKYWSNSLEMTKILRLTSPKRKRPHVLILNILKSQMSYSKLHNFIIILAIVFIKKYNLA